MLNAKKTLLTLSIALAAAAAPSAFAQSANGIANASVQAQAATPAVPATPALPASPAMQGQPPTAAVPAVSASPATPAKKGWSEVDANGNGSLSASEAASIESLAKIFVKADVDANGELTEDEYKAWLAASGKAKANGKADS